MLWQDAHFRPSLSPGQRAMEPTELAVCNVAVIRRTDEQTDHRIYLRFGFCRGQLLGGGP